MTQKQSQNGVRIGAATALLARAPAWGVTGVGVVPVDEDVHVGFIILSGASQSNNSSGVNEV